MPGHNSAFAYANGTPRNRPGLQDPEQLAQIERDLSYLRIVDIADGEAPPAVYGQFDLPHLQAVHHFIFQDVYEWAGRTRDETVEIEGRPYRAHPLIYKDDGLTRQPFIPAPQLRRRINRTLNDLNTQHHLQHLNRQNFADSAALVFAEINAAHPFLEGNGRAQREFLRQLAAQAGHPMHFDVVSQERMSVLSVQARLGDPAGMQQLFRELVDPARTGLLALAERYLEREFIDWNTKLISTTVAGQRYIGQIAVSSPRLVVLKSGTEILVAQRRDLPDTPVIPGSVVEFMATPF